MCEQQRQKEIATTPHVPSALRLGAADLLSPYRTPNSAAAGCNSDWARYSNTPPPQPHFSSTSTSTNAEREAPGELRTINPV
jgi:hypothetical protein